MRRDMHSFIVRIWNEMADDPQATAAWRGSIQHVNSTDRCYFSHLSTIISFIEVQLRAGGELAERGDIRDET